MFPEDVNEEIVQPSSVWLIKDKVFKNTAANLVTAISTLSFC